MQLGRQTFSLLQIGQVSPHAKVGDGLLTRMCVKGPLLMDNPKPYHTMLNRQEALMPFSGRIRQTCSSAAKGKSHQCTDVGASSGRARLRFWYSDSQKNGVKGAMTWTSQCTDA